MTEGPVDSAFVEPPVPLGRPKPSGIGGGLRIFCFIAMVVSPIVTVIIAIGEFRSMTLRLPLFLSELEANSVLLFSQMHTVFAALTVGFGFAAGYTVYSGSQAGRKAAIACFLFVIVGTFCLTGFLENVEQSVRDSIARSNAVRMMVPLFWILYFSFFRRCRNTYNPAYRHIPIREPLSRGERTGWMIWGGLVTLAACVVAYLFVSAPSPVAAPPATHVLDVDGSEIRIPSPRLTTKDTAVSIPSEDFMLDRHFIARARKSRGIVEYIVSSLRVGESEGGGFDWSEESFAIYVENVVEAMRRDAAGQRDVGLEILADEPGVLTLRVTRTTEMGAATVVETMLLAKQRIIRLSAVTEAKSSGVAEELAGLLEEWTSAVIRENGE